MKHFTLKSMLAGGLFAALSIGGTFAQENGSAEPCYGSSVLLASQGLQTNEQPVAIDRSDESKVLGAPSNNAAGSFYSLGVGGFIDISFDGVVFDLPGNDIEVYETSFSGNVCGKNDDEFAYIFLSQDGINWIAADTICRNGLIDIAVTGLSYITAIRIKNAAATNTLDGYDVDAVVALNGCEDFSVLEPNECYGSRALEYIPGTAGANASQTIAAERQEKEKALGAPQRDDTINFVALGFGGSLTIGFDEAAIALPGVNDLEVVETTFGNQNCDSYEERAAVYVSKQVVENAGQIDHNLFVYLGESCTKGAFFDVQAATGWDHFTLVKLVDVTPEAAQLNGRDGYDVDGLVALNGCKILPEVDVTPEPGDCHASEVLKYTPGTGAANISASRNDPSRALGAPQRDDSENFVALGFGGELILGFNGSAIALEGVDDLEVVETTFGSFDCDSYEERAKIFVSQQVVNDPSEIDDNLFVYVGESCTNGASFDVFGATGLAYFTLVKIVDSTPGNAQFSNRDGFDVDGIKALNNECDGEETPTVNPFCTNDEVYQTHNDAGNNVLLTAIGNIEQCDGTYAYRWRIRNRTAQTEAVTYNFAHDATMQGPFIVEAGKEVLFTSGFGQQLGGSLTMRIFVNGTLVNTKAHGTVIKTLEECGKDCGGLQPVDQPLTPERNLNAFPNPSAGAVNVAFSTSDEELVTIEVVDMSGKIVSSMFRQVANAGQEYRLEFNGNNLPNGVYITKMTTSNEVIIKKLMIAH